MQKIIFLDVDGVINIPPYRYFDRRCLNNLYHIINATDASVVVSSSWRMGELERTKEKLLQSGFDTEYINRVIGETCRGYKQVIKGSKLPIVRGNEIKQYVDTVLVYPWHADPSKDSEYKLYNDNGSFKMMRINKVGKDFTYVILDDDSDMLLEHEPYFVHTQSVAGLTYADAVKAIGILNNVPYEVPVCP